MKRQTDADGQAELAGGWAGWILARLRRTERRKPRLALQERIALGPRQSLALVEADGKRILVATSQEGAPAFYALEPGRPAREGRGGGFARRISW